MATTNPYIGAKQAVPAPYTPGPTVHDWDSLRNELFRLQTVVQSLLVVVPQVAVEPPRTPLEGMIRLARTPWNPLGPGDRWVQYRGGSWVAFP
jgi:hypothetical protein